MLSAERSRAERREREVGARSGGVGNILLSQIYTRFARYTVLLFRALAHKSSPRTHPRSEISRRTGRSLTTVSKIRHTTCTVVTPPHSTSRIQSRIAEYAGRSSSSSATTAAIARELAAPRLPDDAGCVIVATAAEEAVVVLLAVVCPAVADG